MALDTNNDVLTDFYLFFSLYTLPHASVSLTGCISTFFFFSFEYFDNYAAFWFPLILTGRHDLFLNLTCNIERFDM